MIIVMVASLRTFFFAFFSCLNKVPTLAQSAELFSIFDRPRKQTTKLMTCKFTKLLWSVFAADGETFFSPLDKDKASRREAVFGGGDDEDDGDGGRE